ncbi:MAG TPA: hypothetical protein VNX70_03740 [Bryobacteraceae bacterium]|jgi:hypothetical protein|nr:hypothetical protein [Bryobacteraceae bacterium]
MKFVLAGFRQNENIRYYSFQGIGDDRRTRTEFSVGVDLTLLHKHRIPLQEAPLMCSFLLASKVGEEQLPSLMFSEADMLVHAAQHARERAGTQNDRRPKPFSPTATRTSPSPVLIEPRNGPSGIGLGSRVGSSLT